MKRVGLDTNVLVRYLTNDDPRQSKIAAAAIRARCTSENPGFINLIVLCEMVWVLERAYGYRRSLIADTINTLCQTPQLSVEQADVVIRAVQIYRQGRADMADCLIGLLNAAQGCSATMTFDKAAATFPEFDGLT